MKTNRNIKLIALGISLISLPGASAKGDNVDDAVVLRAFERALQNRHYEVEARQVRSAFDLCDCDTNRFCRILKQLVDVREDASSRAVDYIGRYGGAGECEFMYSLLSESNASCRVQRGAVESIIRDDFPSTRVLSVVRGFICNTNNTDLSDRDIVAHHLARRFVAFGDTNLVSEARTLLEDFAHQNYLNCYKADSPLRYHFPDYSNSLQRLTYYRDALERGAYRGNGFMLNIMTNELRRLEAVVGNSE